MKTEKELIQEAIEEFEQKIIILQLCISQLKVNLFLKDGDGK